MTQEERMDREQAFQLLRWVEFMIEHTGGEQRVITIAFPEASEAS
jgi:hypothetical protein